MAIRLRLRVETFPEFAGACLRVVGFSVESNEELRLAAPTASRDFASTLPVPGRRECAESRIRFFQTLSRAPFSGVETKVWGRSAGERRGAWRGEAIDLLGCSAVSSRERVWALLFGGDRSVCFRRVKKACKQAPRRFPGGAVLRGAQRALG